MGWALQRGASSLQGVKQVQQARVWERRRILKEKESRDIVKKKKKQHEIINKMLVS